MNSFLIISPDKQAREAFAQNVCNEKHVDPFDRTIIQPQTSLGIEEVREIQKKALLKPFKSSEKAIIIYDAQMATTEAQNALLKLLEEPPQNTDIILTASSTQHFLPTILSRCKIIQVNTQTIEPDQEQKKVIDSLIGASVGTKLVFAQELAKDKEESLTKLKILVYAAHKRMQENPENLLYARIAQVLAQVYKTANSTNINIRFLIEHALLTL